MNPNRLPEQRLCYRIGDPAGRFPIFDPGGSRLASGRWHVAPAPVIYGSERFSTALLEKLAHGSGRLPPNQHYVEIVLPAGISYEVFQPASHPGWNAADCVVARAFGSAWLADARSLLLFVPSVLAPLDANILINPAHPEFARLKAGLNVPVHWDARLFP